MGPTAKRLTAWLTWCVVCLLAGTPIVIAALSPLNNGRGLNHIVGGIAGVVALALLVLQPLLAAGYLPAPPRQRRWHRWVGSAIVLTVLLHIGGLYLASPDDMTDALLLVAPTPFSIYGVVGLWGVVLTAILVATPVRNKFSPKVWRVAHNALAVILVASSITHALMIEGAMGSLSKVVLCICIGAATAIAIVHLRLVKPFLKRRQ